MLTAFEVFEHLVNPMDEIEKMLKLSNTIFFSTELIPSHHPKPGEWWYFGLEHGQHISFYTLRTLDMIAKKFNLNLYSNGTSLHILTDKSLKIPLEFSEEVWKSLQSYDIEWYGPHRIDKIILSVSGGNETLQSVQAIIQSARTFLQNGDLDEAEKIYRDILNVDSQNSEVLHDLGIIAFQKGKLVSASDYFLKALNIKPDFAIAHNNLGVVMNEMGKKEEAKICYEVAISLKPDYAEAYYNRGMVSRDQGHHDEAIVSFQKAVGLKPDYVEASNELEEIKRKVQSPRLLKSIPAMPPGRDQRLKKRMAFVDLAFHQRTKSTLELIEVFQRHFQVDIYWDSGILDFQQIAKQRYDTVVFFQKMYGTRKLDSLNAKNIIFIPMYDDVMGITDAYWRQFGQVKFLNFSKMLHEKLLQLGLKSRYIQYYVPAPKLPNPVTSFKGLSGFFWQRTNYIRWSTIKILIQNVSIEKFHLHSAVDPPNHIFEKPSDEDIKKYGITISDWFPGKEAYLTLVDSAKLFFAPRPFEGIGMSFLEAMAMGKCVIAPDLPTMNEYIQDGENGLLYDPKKPVPLDFSQADQIGMKARVSSEEGYRTWKEAEKGLIQFITDQ